MVSPAAAVLEVRNSAAAAVLAARNLPADVRQPSPAVHKSAAISRVVPDQARAAVPAASAGVRSAAYLSLHQAKKGAMRSAKERSDFSTPTGGYGVVRCHRISGQKVRCKDFAEFHDGHNSFKHTVTWWVVVTRDERGHLLYRNLKDTEHDVGGYPYD